MGGRAGGSPCGHATASVAERPRAASRAPNKGALLAWRGGVVAVERVGPVGHRPLFARAKRNSEEEEQRKVD